LPFCHVHFRGRKPPHPAYPRALRTLGDHLRKRRLDLGPHQKQLGRQLGVDPETIHNWELGRTAPALCWMPRIISFLGYDPRPQPKIVGKALKRHRMGEGMSQRDLADVLEVDPSTLAKWEREERVPTGTCLERVERLLNAQSTVHCSSGERVHSQPLRRQSRVM
jgi:transcriptional regulator with XRE-family HTH domain